MSNVIKLRFLVTKDFAGWAITTEERICMPFTPSHCECVTPAGKYLGQHANGGMQAREPGYDAGTVENEMFLDLDATPEQVKSFYDHMESKIGQPYDWAAILDYAIPGANFHLYNHAICSAALLLGLRAKPAPWLLWPTAVPAHLVDPAKLLFGLSMRVEVRH